VDDDDDDDGATRVSRVDVEMDAADDDDDEGGTRFHHNQRVRGVGTNIFRDAPDSRV